MLGVPIVSDATHFFDLYPEPQAGQPFYQHDAYRQNVTVPMYDVLANLDLFGMGNTVWEIPNETAPVDVSIFARGDPFMGAVGLVETEIENEMMVGPSKMADLFAVQDDEAAGTVCPSDTVVQKESFAPKKSLAQNEMVTKGRTLNPSKTSLVNETLILSETLNHSATFNQTPHFTIATHIAVPVYQNGSIKKDKRTLPVREFDSPYF
jgi:hypothetical protein